MKPAIAYLRVSTQRQGESGLGEEAQREAVRKLCADRGMTLSGEFTEVESGRKCDRPALGKALEAARLSGAVVVVAKLDRLARDTEFVLRLSSEAEKNGMGGFLFCDLPDVDATNAVGRLILTVMASVAEFEARRISERTKDALAARKARGLPMGSQCPAYRGHETRRKKARAFAKKVGPEIRAMFDCGMSWVEVVEELNQSGTPTPSGNGRWHKAGVSRVLKTLKGMENV
ncbi:MAG: recombinase family protein [Gammaproteobacteria bacterium]